MIVTALYAYLIKNKIKNKIYFFTWTVSQMNQIIKEVKSSAYESEGTLMISKKKLCGIEMVA